MTSSFAPVPLLAACLLATGAAATTEVRKDFHLPAGAAAATLQEFAHQADVTVLAGGDDVAGVRTVALDGRYSPREAIVRLLAGTGLESEQAANGSLLVRRKPAPTPTPPPRAPTQLPQEDPPQVLVVGTRAAEQSAIDRKNHAATARDTIFADDVNSFPDHNVAEAVSRIAGVALDRGEYGEGVSASIRGVSTAETRVEIDGLSVMSAGGTDLNGGGGGRGVELRELPTELIASVDVVKGYTPDMTEGSLGGSILIKTRTGFDFKRRTISLRSTASQNSINEKWTPSTNLLFADQYLGGRLGLVFNISSAENRLESHQQQINDNNSGYTRAIDFDNSPEKTFQYNPATVSGTDPAATAPMYSWAQNGGGRFTSLTPLDIVTRSAAARTKQDCYTQFPWYTQAQLAAISRGADRAAAQDARAEEIRSCLNQWSDYMPSSIRYMMKRQNDRRLNADLRLDFKVNDNLGVYAKYNRGRRTIEEQVMFLSLGGIRLDGAGSAFPVYSDSVGAFPGVTRTVTADGAAAGYYLFPGGVGNAGTDAVTNQFRGLTNGRVLNLLPSSVVVDANHHVTAFQLTNAYINNDTLWTQMESSTATASFGANWRAGRWRAELLWGRTEGEFWRYNLRSNVNFPYGSVNMSVLPSGLWSYTLPANASLNQMDLSNYGQLTAQANGQLRSAATQLTLDNPRAAERSENNFKLDLGYNANGQLGPIQLIRFGLNRRGYDTLSWSGTGGYTVAPGAVVPQANVASNFTACEAAGSATPCPYGVSYSTNPLTAHNSAIIMSQADYRTIIGQGLAAGPSALFYNSARDQPVMPFSSWVPLDAARVIALTGVNYMDLGCVKRCTASDGKVYDQPVSAVFEHATAGYVSAAFGLDELPFGATLDGNFGWRYVRTEVGAKGLLTLRSILKTSAYNPAVPEAAAGIRSLSVSQNTELRRSGTDFMPMLNLALWAVPDTLVLRYSRAKVVARPAVSRLVTAGVTCTYDERKLSDAGTPVDMTCDDVMGNPGLRPKTNHNSNLSLEWYASRDSMLSATVFRQRGIIGDAVVGKVSAQYPFQDSGTADPGSGKPLSTISYSYPTWVEGPAATRVGLELGGRTAFTRLPWLLRHTGVNANITAVRSRNAEVAVLDPITGDLMAPTNEPRYSWNSSLWYDDGKLSIQLALQVTTASFARLAEGKYAPANGLAATNVATPFNPGSVMFRDTRRWLDAKVAYRIGDGVELFAEARNLGRAAQTESLGGYAAFADGIPSIYKHIYGGARYSAGITIRQR